MILDLSHGVFLDECKDREILRNVDSCIIEKGTDKDRFWEEAAQIVFTETAIKVQKENKTLREFIDLLLKAPLEESQKYLSESYGASLVDKNTDKMALSIRATLINSVYAFDVLREDPGNNFSIKSWIDSSKQGFLFLSCSPKERTTVIPMITAWLSISIDSLMQTPETNKRTWFFIDELHSLKRLPKLDLALAEIRKYGGCFVMGTQLVSQLEKIYGKDLTRSITGLCGTKVVMNVPEPITAKYMADFLEEKEEITSMETISYGANTIRDGANISQRYSKESVVSGSQIMSLSTGEAFVRFYDIPVVGKIKFKLHVQESSNKIKDPELDIDKKSKKIDIFEKSEKEIREILEYLRITRTHAIVLDDDGTLTQRFVKNIDTVLDPINDPYSWDIVEEFNNSPMKFLDFALSKDHIEPMQKREIAAYFTAKINELSQTRPMDFLGLLTLDNLDQNILKRFSYMSILNNDYLKISLRKYHLGTVNYLVFLSCQNFGEKVSDMIIDLASSCEIYIVGNTSTIGKNVQDAGS